MSIEKKIAQILIKKKLTLAIAESCTGGLLTHRLTNIPGSSHFLQLSIIAYSNPSKIKLLKVPSQMIEKHGAVSESVAIAMAKNIRKMQKTDFGISITGIAGPTGGNFKKPVGLTYISLGTKSKTICQRFIFKGSRARIKSQAATKALELFLRHFNGLMTLGTFDRQTQKSGRDMDDIPAHAWERFPA